MSREVLFKVELTEKEIEYIIHNASRVSDEWNITCCLREKKLNNKLTSLLPKDSKFISFVFSPDILSDDNLKRLFTHSHIKECQKYLSGEDE